jgi:hypothetical protein
MQATEDTSFNTGQNATNECQQQILSALTASRSYQLQMCINGTWKFDVWNKRITTESTGVSGNENMIVIGLTKNIKQQRAIENAAEEETSQLVTIYSKTSLWGFGVTKTLWNNLICIYKIFGQELIKGSFH